MTPRLKVFAWFTTDHSCTGFGVDAYDPDLEWGGIKIARVNVDPVTDEPTTGYVTNMVVQPLYRRKGVAKAVMEQAEATARHFGFKALSLKSTTKGVKFYQSLGYSITATQEELATDPDLQNHIPMRKELCESEL